MKIEGKNAVYELLKTDKTIDKILLENGSKDETSRKIKDMARERGVKVQFADRSALSKESETGKCQGVIAYTSDFRYTETEDILAAAKAGNGFLVALAGVEDVHNLASVLRVCECAGVDGVIIPARRSAAVTDDVVRISAGAANHVKVARVTNLNAELDKIKEAGYWVTGAEADGEDIYRADLTGNVCIVIGGEDSGIPQLTKKKCDRIVALPMHGKVNSLNASVACGITVYEVLRQRTQRG